MNPLRTYLAAEGVTQVRFAEMIGVQQSMVSRLLKGKARPSLETAVAIERATGGAVPAATWVPETDPDAGAVKGDESSGPERDATARSAFVESARGNAGLAPAPETGEDAGDRLAAGEPFPGAASAVEPAAGAPRPAAGVSDLIARGGAA